MPIVLWSAALSQPIRPGRCCQLRVSRVSSVSGRAAASLMRSLQRVEITEQRLQIVGRQAERRHVDTRLHGRRVADPTAAVATAVRQSAGAETDAARDMRQIGADLAVLAKAADRVTHGAISGKDLPPMLIGVRNGFGCAALFDFEPAAELVRGCRDDIE